MSGESPKGDHTGSFQDVYKYFCCFSLSGAPVPALEAGKGCRHPNQSLQVVSQVRPPSLPGCSDHKPCILSLFITPLPIHQVLAAPPLKHIPSICSSLLFPSAIPHPSPSISPLDSFHSHASNCTPAPGHPFLTVAT